jgi:hypothetical protein
MIAAANNDKVPNASKPVSKSTAERFPRVVGLLFQNGNHRIILSNHMFFDVPKLQSATNSIMHESKSFHAGMKSKKKELNESTVCRAMIPIMGNNAC